MLIGTEILLQTSFDIWNFFALEKLCKEFDAKIGWMILNMRNTHVFEIINGYTKTGLDLNLFGFNIWSYKCNHLMLY